MKRIVLSVLAFLTIVNFCALGKKTSLLEGKQFVPGHVLIKFKTQSHGTLRKSILQSQRIQSTLQKIGAVAQKAVFNEAYSTSERQRIAEEIGLNRWVDVTVPSVTDMENLLIRLKQDPNVEIAEPIYLEQIKAAPRDPFGSLQEHLRKINAAPNDSFYSLQQSLVQIKASQAWDIQHGDSTVIIAIIDCGVDWHHPDLAANIWNNPSPGPENDIRGWDFVDVTGRSATGADPADDLYNEDNDPMDGHGHGTNCAGIAGAVTNNSIGVASISWGCKIMPLRVVYRLTDGNGWTYSDWIARAFQYAADHGASVASLSLGVLGSMVIDGALYAFRNGVVICSAAGNDNNETPYILGPQPWVLNVAAVNNIDQKASYSSYGTWINISAPGRNLTTFKGGLYGSGDAASFSTPLVAGLAGLVKSRFPTMTSPEIVLQICATADNIDGINPSYAGKLGYGRINAQNAVTSVASAMLPNLSFSSVSFSDATGNNNGKIDPGETIEMTVFLKNDWDNATNTTATISTSAWGINITKASASYGTIPGIRDIDHSIKGNTSDKFVFTVSPDSIPRSVTFTISVAADLGYTKSFDVKISILPHLLFVDDDDGIVNVEQYYTDAFSRLGIVYDYWNRSVQGPLTASQLSAYKTVVWGCEWALPPLNALDRTAIGGFLDNGGNLFISGQDIGADLCSTLGKEASISEYYISAGESKTWYENYFNTQFQADNAGTATLYGVSGDPIGDGLTLSFSEPLRTSGQQFPDIITPLSGAQSIFQYLHAAVGATRYASTYKVVNFGFGGFEAITDASMRDTVMNRIYNWFNGSQFQHTPLKDIESPDSQRVQVKVLSTGNIESVNLYWDTDGAFPFNKRPMQSMGGGLYESYVPAQTSSTFQYTILVRTASGYLPRRVYSYKVGVDSTAPVFLSADSLWGTLNTSGVFAVAVGAIDNGAIDTNATYIVFRVNSSELDSARLQYSSQDNFKCTFNTQSLVPQLQHGDVISYYYSIRDASSQHNYTRLPSSGFYSFIIGRQLIDNFEQMLPIWDLGLSWGYEKITSPRNSKIISDSPPANTPYLPNAENTLTLIQSFDLSEYTNAKLCFYHRINISTGDTLYIEYQKGTEGWITARKMRGSSSWKKDSIDLQGSSSATAVRFRLKSDGANQANGILIDDIEVVGVTPITGIEKNDPVVTPKNFALLQNYPNPFNPTTTIEFSIPKSSIVNLKIFDLLGREVAVLVNEQKPPGTYTVQFDGSRLASGVYFYRLQAENFVQTKKFVLLR